MALVNNGWRARRAAIRWMAGVFAAAVIAAAAGCAPAVEDVALEQALKDGRVSAVFANRGTYGDVMIAAITSRADGPLAVMVERGTRLRNLRPGGESFAVYGYKGRLGAPYSASYQRERRLTLGGRGDTAYALLESYSLNALAEPAAENDAFAVDGRAAPDTLAVLQASAETDSIEAKQIAVWATTDDVTVQDMQEIAFACQPHDLDAARAILRRAGLDPDKYRIAAVGSRQSKVRDCRLSTVDFRLSTQT
jgi:hypothetical protein